MLSEGLAPQAQSQEAIACMSYTPLVGGNMAGKQLNSTTSAYIIFVSNTKEKICQS